MEIDPVKFIDLLETTIKDMIDDLKKDDDLQRVIDGAKKLWNLEFISNDNSKNATKIAVQTEIRSKHPEFETALADAEKRLKNKESVAVNNVNISIGGSRMKRNYTKRSHMKRSTKNKRKSRRY